MSAMSGSGKSAVAPIPMIVGGLCLLFLFFVAFLAEIETTEAAMLAQPITTPFIPVLDILKQPGMLLMARHTLSAMQAMAYIVGWGMDGIFLLAVFGFEAAREGIGHLTPKMAKPFLALTVVILAFNTIFDIVYNQAIPSGWWGQGMFALIEGFLVMFALPSGLSLIRHGVKVWFP